jgi:hypothetical protein
MRREEKRRCGGGVQRSPCWSFSLVFSFLISFCVEGFSRIYFILSLHGWVAWWYLTVRFFYLEDVCKVVCGLRGRPVIRLKHSFN